MKKLVQTPLKTALGAATALLIALSASAAEYQGYFKVEHFDDITGGAIANLTGAAKYIANEPDSTLFMPIDATATGLFYSRSPGEDNYGARISGYLTPTETAEYVFFVASDDSTSFYLSTDADPANLKLIAADQGWQNSRTWTGPGGTSSGDGTVDVVFRRGFNPGPEVLQQNGFQWVGPFQNRSDEFLNSPLANLATPEQRWPVTDTEGNAVITLNASQKYYFELLFKEGSGGENTGVAWKKAGEPDPVNGATGTEIPKEFLSVEAPEALTFKTHPQSQTVQQGHSAHFTVELEGIPGDSDPATWGYQWYVDGSPIFEGTYDTATYTIPEVSLADNNKTFYVEVYTFTGQTLTSDAATLSVVSDTESPTITRVRTSDTFTSAKITFSEAVANGAVDPANYSFTGGLTVTDANFDIVSGTDDPKNPVDPLNRQAVILFTSAQAEGVEYTLTLNNVTDMAGNPLTPNTATVHANVFMSGVMNYKRWEGGNNIPNLLNDPLRLADPTVVATRTVAETGGEAGTYVAGNYVDRVDGFFIPEVSGEYVFFISADNDGYIYLSTDSDPANRKLIGADVGWQNTREWTGPGGDTDKRRGDGTGGGPFENRSDELLTSERALDGTGLLAGLLTGDGLDPEPWPTTDAEGNAVINLEAGTRYAFQLWHVEGDSGRAEATFKLASEPDPVNGTVSRMTGDLIGAFVDPSSLLPIITLQPVDVDFTAGGTLTFTVEATSALPFTYQWFKNGVAIEGETSATLTIEGATSGDIGAYHVAVTNANGTVDSDQALALAPVVAPGLTFQQDTTGTVVIEAEHFYDSSAATDGHLWVPLSARTGFSGEGYMAVLPDSGVNLGNTGFVDTGARLDYRIVFENAGTHYIWLRGGDPVGNGSGDSVHAGINGQSPATATRIDGAPTFNVATGWNWVGNIQGDTRATIEVPSAGTHTVSLWMREDGFLVDKLILTTDVDFTPTGTGPAESEQAGGGDEPTISVSRNASGDPVITYTGTLESSSEVDGTYAPVQGASGGTYTVDVQAGGPHQFYRSSE